MQFLPSELNNALVLYLRVPGAEIVAIVLPVANSQSVMVSLPSLQTRTFPTGKRCTRPAVPTADPGSLAIFLPVVISDNSSPPVTSVQANTFPSGSIATNLALLSIVAV